MFQSATFLGIRFMIKSIVFKKIKKKEYLKNIRKHVFIFLSKTRTELPKLIPKNVFQFNMSTNDGINIFICILLN